MALGQLGGDVPERDGGLSGSLRYGRLRSGGFLRRDSDLLQWCGCFLGHGGGFLGWWLRIPTIADSDSDRSRTLIPIEGGQRFR
jgi:hypothetical protein